MELQALLAFCIGSKELGREIAKSVGNFGEGVEQESELAPRSKWYWEMLEFLAGTPKEFAVAVLCIIGYFSSHRSLSDNSNYG